VNSAADLPPRAANPLELERWEADRAFREREVAVREREQATRDAELALAREAHAAARWKSPVVVAILAAAVAAAGNALVAYTNNRSQTELEAQKSEQARILEMIKTGNPDAAAENLRFLLSAGLISYQEMRRDLTAFLDSREPGSGPALPSTTSIEGAKLAARFEGTVRTPYKDDFGRTVIGSGHVLTQEELRTGTLRIGGELVSYRDGITMEQATALLAQDLEPVRKQVDELVTVPLTENQLDALTSFAYNVGIGAFRGSNVLKKLNAGRYEAVPAEMMRWVKVGGGETVPGLVARRRAEVARWNE
jgi:GH24 family phage-related lysozyme (muramidase)